MRDVALDHWHYYTWHLPAGILMLVALALVWRSARSLRRDTYGHAQRALRWKILGWSALLASITSAIVWPYLTAAARVHVEADGSWRVSNYLGVPLASVPADEVRELRGVDLGGLGIGQGVLEIRRANGDVIRSVRLSRSTLDDARRALGYPDAMVADRYGDQVIAAHRYQPGGPRRLVVAALP